MAEMSDYCENLVLNHTLGTSDIGSFVTQMYLALHTGDPTDVKSTALANEVDVARQTIDFGTASGTGGSVASTTAQSFTSMPDVTVTHIGIWNHLSAGELMYHTAVAASKDVDTGDTISVAIGAVTVTLA
jgi:hypothetical protein